MAKKLELVYEGVVYSKKNSKRIITNPRTGNQMLISSKNAYAMEADMAGQFIRQTRGYVVDESIKWEVEMHIYRKDNVRRDLDNMATSILDGLVRGKVLPDDCVNYVKKLVVVDAGVDKQNPRAEITLSEVVL